MSSIRGSETLTDILPDLCKVCRKIPEWYSNMPGCIPGFTSHMGHPEMPELIPAALVVETAARGHLKCLRAAISASHGEYECIDGIRRLEPGNRPLLQYGTLLLYGPSALMAAAWNGHPRCVKLLIKEKFIMCVEPGEAGTTPICVAVKGNNRKCFDLLFKAHRKRNSMIAVFENAMERGFGDCVKMLINAGADVNQVDKYGRTPLMCRNPSDNSAIIKTLIDAGADPNIDNLGETALTTHMDEESFKSVCILLEAGADVNAISGKVTPLMHVVDGFVENKYTFVVALLLKGAKINIPVYSGVNPLTRSLTQSEPEDDRKIQNLLFAAGEKIDKQAVESEGNKVPKHLQPQFNLKDICRRKIREHLLDLDPHTHLFGRVRKIGLPSLLTSYLLYDQTLDDTEYMEILSMADDDDISFVDFDSDDYSSSDNQDVVSSDEDADDDDNEDNNDDVCDISDGQDVGGSDEDIDDNDDDDNNDDVCNSSDGQDVNGSDDNVDDNNDNDDDDFIDSDDADDFGSSDGQDVDDHDDDNTDVVSQDIVSNEDKTGDKSL